MQNKNLHSKDYRYLDNSIEYLKGVGPQKAEVLKSELGLFTWNDLLHFFPHRYIDKSVLHRISDFRDDGAARQVRGVLSRIGFIQTGKTQKMTARLSDDTGSIDLIWFKNYQYIRKILKEGQTYTVYGKAGSFMGHLNLPHPEMKEYKAGEEEKVSGLEPVYPLTEKLRARFMDSRFLHQAVRQIIHHPEFSMREFIPQEVLKPLKLPERTTAFRNIHDPGSVAEAGLASERIKFEEMFVLAMRSEKIKSVRHHAQDGIVMKGSGNLLKEFYHDHLSFELTDAQKRVIREISSDMSGGVRMNRLLQGDVGSGKTIVALFCMLKCIDNGYQACLMAPTEILATQHFLTIRSQLSNMPVRVELLTGSTGKKQRSLLLEELREGRINILIGTHALIEDDVRFKKPGLAVIDEQHRFGVAQRAELWNRYEMKPHVLVMTATPIPRTLAMTVHGELDVSVIDELPRDRKPVKTVHRESARRAEVMRFLKTEISKGRQVYIVYPLIEESSKLDLNDLMNGYDVVCSYFPVPEYQISLLHGKMKPEVKELEMRRFKEGITQIMISTTVIEVGVNVPNATVMVIENAERFGLSQLHQLRGRVGRGGEQSYCILMTQVSLNPPAKKRIQTMCNTTDGFEISKTDLELRGPGDILGTRQSGLPEFKLLDLVQDVRIIDLAKRAAAFVLKNDPELSLPSHEPLLDYLKKHQKDHFWSRVS